MNDRSVMVSSLLPHLFMPRKIDASDRADRPISQESTSVSSPLDTIRSWLRSSIARSPSSPRGKRQQRTLSMERLGERAMMAGDLGNLPEEPAGYISYEQGEGEGPDPAPTDALNAALTDQALLQMMLDEEHSKELLTNRSWGTSLMIDSQNVKSAGVSPSGDVLAVGKSDGTLAFYTAGTGIEQTEKALQIGAPITSLKYLSNGNLVVTTDKSFRVIDANGVTVKTVNYTQGITKMNTLDNGFFVFVYASAGLPSSVILYDQKGEQTYKKDISPNVGVVSVTNDGSTMMHGAPGGTSVIAITASGKSFGIDISNILGRGSGTASAAELNADGTGRFMLAEQGMNGTILMVTDATGKILVRDHFLGQATAVQNIVSLGGGRFLVDVMQDGVNDVPRTTQSKVFKYALGALTEESTLIKQPGYQYSPLSVSADATTVTKSQYNSVVVGSLPSSVVETKALQDGAKKIGPAVINNAQLDNSLGKNLVNGQRSDLVGLAQTFSSLTTLKYNNTMIFTKFLATFADWRDENAVATAKAKNWSMDYFYYARGQEFESFNKDIGSYDDALGRMMEAGMNAVLADVRFQDPTPALTSLRAIPKDVMYGSTLAHIARLGIVLPSETEIISACKAILVKGSDAYQDMQGIYQNRTDNAVRIFNSNNYTDYVQPPPTVPDTIFDRKSWIAAMEITDKLAKMEMARNAQPMPAGAEATNIASSLSPQSIASAMKSEISALLAQGKTMESILRDLQMMNGGQSLQSMEREKVKVGNDVVTKMNRASLEALKATALKALPNATIRSAEAEIMHWTIMLEATNGLLGLIPAGGTEPDLTKDPMAEMWRKYIDRTSTDPKGDLLKILTIDYSQISDLKLDSATDFKIIDSASALNWDEKMSLRRIGVATATFELKKATMTNLTIDTPANFLNANEWKGPLDIPLVRPNLTLTLIDTTNSNEKVKITSKNAKQSAETISAILEPGKYRIEIRDENGEKAVRESQLLGVGHKVLGMPLSVSFKPLDSRKIEGSVSIDGSPVSKPVSMSVAEFNSETGKRKESSEVSPLNPNLPVWVVVHGMESSESETSINELTKALANHPSVKGGKMQVATINWEVAAKSLSHTGTDAPWTDAVGPWIAQQLLSLGFAPEKIAGIGHSHGAYNLHSMGAELMKLSQGKQMNTLIALDPAGNPPWTGFDHTKINFANVSARSTAFEVAWITDSNKLASTADLTFKVDSPIGYRPDLEHSLGMNLFISQLQADANRPGNMSQHFGLDALRTLTEGQITTRYTKNQYGEVADAPAHYIKFAEALIDVDVNWIQINSKDFAITSPRTLKRIDPQTGQEDTLLTDSILP